MKFKLEPILKLRENQEKVKKRELGELTQQVSAIEQNIEKVTNEMEMSNRICRTKLMGSVDIAYVKQSNLANKMYREKLDLLKAKLKEMEVKIEAKKKELAEAMTDRKIIEKLKEKEFDKFMQEENNKQLAIVDELVSYKYSTMEV